MLLSSGAVLTLLSDISLIFLHPQRFQSIYWTLIFEDPLWVVRITEYLSSFIKIFFFVSHLDFKEVRRPALSCRGWNWCITIPNYFPETTLPGQKQSLSPLNPLVIHCSSDPCPGFGDLLVAHARHWYCSISSLCDKWCWSLALPLPVSHSNLSQYQACCLHRPFIRDK